MQYKFGITLTMEDCLDLEPEDLQDRILKLATETYSQREIEFPVMGGLIHFTTRDGSGNRRYDREQLVDWARERFGVKLDLEDLRSKQREEIRATLLAQSRINYEEGQNIEEELHTRGDAVCHGTDGATADLVAWGKDRFEANLDPEVMARWDNERLTKEIHTIWQDRFCPEIRRMERSLTLQILDAAWKDHLLAMDHLRSSVGLRGYAQVDPKVEYKREGMRTFDAMWEAIQERVTDLIFRMDL